MAKTPTWQRAAGKNPEGGLNEAGRRSLRAAGHDIKRPQPEGGPRKKSFCARMKGMKAKLTSSETANDPDSRINKSLRKWKCADGGEITVDNALRMAQGRPDEGGQERFLREQLAGSAPQYEPSQDFPARAERAVQAADRYAGVLNDLAARGAGLPKEFQSPQGRSAREIVESALPQDPNAVVKQAMRQAGEGNRLAAAETMLGGIPETGAIRAYHGSPHRFDKFDISKIGTGEGAQAYGHGLYFAENEDIAAFYRNKLAKNDGSVVRPDDIAVSSIKDRWDSLVNKRREIWEKTNGMPTEDTYKIDAALDALHNEAVQDTIKRNPHLTQGSMYEVEIAAEPHQLLDWDKPLSEQPEAIRRKLGWTPEAEAQYRAAQSADANALLAALEGDASGYTPSKIPVPAGLPALNKTGADIVRGGSVFDRASDIEKAAKLREAGIPGIQYLDAGSRGAGEGSRNFVIFDPSLIDIKRRYADGGDVTVDNALRMARNMGGGTLYNQLNYALNSPTPANPPQDPGPQQPYYQSLAQTRDIVQQYGAPAPGAPTSSAVRQPMPYAKGGKAIWNKPRPKSLGKSEPLSPSQKASAKAMAKAAGRPYPNMVDNLRAARKADGGQVEGDVQFAPNDLPMMARQPDVEIKNALRMARSAEPVKYDTGPQQGEAVMRPYEPTIKERIYQTVAGTEQRPSSERAGFARGISQMAEFMPVLGNVMAGQEAYRRGDTKGMLMAALPVPGAATEARMAQAAAAPAEQAMREAYQRALNSTGLYSHAAEAAYNLPQAKGSYEQMIAMLQKAGVKPEELYWSGVEKAFKGQPRVTREQLVSHFEQNVPKIEETVLGSYQNPYSHRTADEWQAAINRAERAGNFDEAERLTNAWEHFEGYGASGASGSAKFQQYTIPGGENYREVLLHTPSQKQDLYKQISRAREDRIAAVKEHGSVLKYDDPALEQERLQKIREATKRENDLRAKLENIAPEYTSSHWDQPNVLGHLRMSDRTGPEGEKILHLEELQSDWGQEGRKKGFREQKEKEFAAAVAKRDALKAEFEAGNQSPEIIDQMNVLHDRIRELGVGDVGLPAAPYVASHKGTHSLSWVDLGLKRSLKEAAEGGYDKMVWTPGAEQAARYDLSKQINRVGYTKRADGKFNISAEPSGGGDGIDRQGVSIDEVENLLGKEIADKINKAETNVYDRYNGNITGELTGLDLKLGGEGMKGFYDKIVPNRLKELLKKIDPKAKMSFSEIQGKDGPLQVPTLEITPKIRKALKRGLPAFADGGEVVN